MHRYCRGQPPSESTPPPRPEQHRVSVNTTDEVMEMKYSRQGAGESRLREINKLPRAWRQRLR